MSTNPAFVVNAHWCSRVIKGTAAKCLGVLPKHRRHHIL
uniref:Uncharacterized protein n=1 Tax=Bacillus subtilis TaxID=1423 RepID=P70967_BACIU|nr:unknown [Bacillus subtilis subsp. subtilis str. 168]